MKPTLSILLISLTFLSRAQDPVPHDQVKITETPDWVEPLTWDRSQTDRDRRYLDGDTHYLLFDQQINARPDERQSFRQVVYRFLTETGVQDNAQLEFAFDPEYEHIEFHSLIVHRDGEASDRLPDQQIKIIQREEDMNRHLYDGRLSAVLVLEDIRVGDVLEYSFTRTGANPIFGDHYMRSFSTQWSIPINHASFRLLWPSARELFYKAHSDDIEPEVSENGGISEYIWDMKAGEPLIADDAVPSWFNPWGWVQISDFKDWKEVAAWALNIYEIDESLPKELEKVIEEARQLDSPDAQAREIVYYVQDQFRYLGVESGINSHKPYPIETILSRRFGDCKDKSTLLCAMLRNLGLEAYPALVDTSEKRTIEEYLPSVNAFNHVIVQLRLEDQTVWIDPTIRLQGGSLRNMYFPNYGRALVIAPDTETLTDIDRTKQEETSIKVTEAFDFQDYDGPGVLQVTTVFRGYEADRMRRRLAESSIAEMERDYANFYAYSYDEVEAVDPLEFEDDRDTNVITCFESYHIASFWETDDGDDEDKEEGDESLPRIRAEFSAQNFKGYLNKPDTRNRSMPFALSYPSKVTHEILADFPWPLKFDDDEEKIDSNSFSAAFKRTTSTEGLKLWYTYQSKGDHVTPDKFNQYIDDIERIEDSSYYSFSVPGEWAHGSAPPEKVSGIEAGAGSSDFLNGNRTLLAWVGGISLFLVLLLLLGIGLIIALVAKHKPAPRTDPSSPPPLPDEKRNP